jgi:serine/threonine protein kinase/Flp pilus assembly protein TadD
MTSATLATGTVLARRYRVLTRLGEGGMGSVYQVEDLTRPGTVWALKELLDDRGMSPEDLAWAAKRFEDEIALMARLAHPRIPAFVDRFTEGGRRYFVMEFIPGLTLEQRLERTHAPLPERDVLTWMIGICDVLSYLHGQRPPIIVRDLKPGNIMVTPSGDVRLIDFGIARTYKPGQKSNTENLGTMTYASPEHLGQSQTDPRSDIYSLGATMYHLLTNAEPPPLETPAPGQMRKYNPALGEATERTIIRAMRQIPAERFQTAVEMREALRSCLQALPAPVSASAPSVSSSAPSTAARAASAPSTAARQPVLTRPSSSSSSSAAPAVARPAAPATIVCPRCGYRNRRTAKFCARDGAPLPSASRASRAAPPAPVPVTRVVATTTTAELHARRATEAFGAGKYMQAVQQSQAAIKEGRATYDVYLLLGRAYRQLGRHIEAAEAFAQAGRLRPTAEACYQEGMALRGAGQLDRAQIALTRARALDPQSGEIGYQLGLLCLDLGQLAQAEGELREALAHQPGDPPVLVALGRVEAARKRWQEAGNYFRQAIAVSPRDAAAHLELGRALLAAGRLPEATRSLEEAARVAPESVEVQTALGMAYHAGGRRSAARSALRRAVALDPTDADAQRLLKQL